MKYDFDRELSTRRKRKKKRSSSGLVIGLSIGGGVLLLAVVGVVLYLSLGKGKGDPLGIGGLLDAPNEKVTEETYHALKDGMTIAEVEAIFGNGGRTPSAGDFDAIFGEFVPELAHMPSNRQRQTWGLNHERGLVRIWTNGSQMLMILYSQPPDQGGRLVGKLFRHADGSLSMSYGIGQPPKEPPPQPQRDPNKNPPPQGSAGDWEQLVGTWEVVGDPRIRIRFTADKKMGDIFMVDGRQVREKVYTVRSVKVENGRIAPQLALGTVNGQAMNSAALGVFWFENGTLHRDPGNGKAQQTLRRVD